MKRTTFVLLCTALTTTSVAQACVMDGIGSGALTSVPPQTYNVQLAMYQALDTNKITSIPSNNYDQKFAVLMYQLQHLVAKNQDMFTQDGEFFFFESSKGHYFKMVVNQGSAKILPHEVPKGESLQDAIVTDIDALGAIVSQQITLQDAIALGVFHIPDTIQFV
ncbi:hypothetical protein J4N42_22040 [Vibrio sp. SCSIO 43135]|uniref:hypothetical protein n=1 Tax=Vibrio sp. SCSIO 43135 TaxID=2819096 RepID=UPI002076650C|nr:hypothetical protein [Vibrio sp. SCSIO 43135]USD43273.1 hypothetical protein J4N42_22040 [Vibrio sp. SCSIO 43135]